MIRDSYVNMIEKDATLCYGLCKMTVSLESENSNDKYKRLYFVELLELIGRMADLKYKNNNLSLT